MKKSKKTEKNRKNGGQLISVDKRPFSIFSMFFWVQKKIRPAELGAYGLSSDKQ